MGDYRIMWFTQVDGVFIAGGISLHYGVNLHNMLSNDIKTTKEATCASYLHSLMASQERHRLNYIHKTGILRGCTWRGPELPAGM